MPKGLIPLMLSSSESTSSFTSRSNGLPRSPTRAEYSPPILAAHRRYYSDVSPVIKSSRPPVRSSMKRQSQQPPAALPQIPYGSAEWKRAISEIKRYYVAPRYRACSARCNEILTNIKDTSAVEPAYLIYLHFYAATSLEMCARPLAPAAAYRISLLQQARAHYERAAALIRAAEDAALLRSRPSSAASSLPSLHSPSNTVFSRACTPESGATTPTTCTLSRKSSLNVSSSSCSACTARPVKKVSFELPRGEARCWSSPFPIEPTIRPDSPTLGFDDVYFAAGATRQDLPELPPAAAAGAKRASRAEFLDCSSACCSVTTATATTTTTSLPFPLGHMPLPMPMHMPMPSISERDEPLLLVAGGFGPGATSSSSSTDAPSPLTDDGGGVGGGGDEYPFFALPPPQHQQQQQQHSDVDAALRRYCTTLVGLKGQVASHTAALDDVLAAALLRDAPGAEPEAPGLHDAGGGGRQSWRSSSSNSGGGGLVKESVDGGGGCRSGSGGDAESAEKLRERRARIDRLRIGGWRRKRFDASRYQDLCNVVMAELNED